MTDLKAMADDSLMNLLTDGDPGIRMRGRLVATGLCNTILQWAREERERGGSPVDVTTAAIVVCLGQIGLMFGDSMRTDTPDHIQKAAIEKYVQIAATSFASSFAAGLER